MNTNIKVTNISLSESISAYVEKKLAKIEKLAEGDTALQCDIELARTSDHHNKGDVFRAEIHITGSGKNYFAKAEREDLYAAIDEARDDIMREMTGGKARQISLVRRSGAKVKDMVRGLWPFGK